MNRRPRWRCADPTCPAHQWQPVTQHGEYDPVDVALGELERHWRDKHQERKAADAVGA